MAICIKCQAQVLWLGSRDLGDDAADIMHLVPAVPCSPPALRRIPAEAVWACPTVAPVTVLTGRAWITQAGDPRDHVVDSGDQWQPIGGGRVVIQALGGPLTLRLGTG